ncbi:MAG TPA: DUF3618 domain-containing protein [Pseudonocardia sp.]|nr:DUF3618 domain-containing protein [Pseudonocardia sp.]
MTTPSSNDPDQIRREIERTQAALSSDVDVLTEKVSPSRIVERRVDRVKDTANRWKDQVMGSMPNTHSTSGTHIGGSGGGVRDTAQHAVGTVTDTASSAASSVSGAASNAASTVADAAQAAPSAIRQQTRGNPLAAGVIAFGAGWLLSSLLPATRREQEVATQAQERAAELRGPLTEVANEVKDNLAGPAQEALQSVRSTATEAGQTVADESRVAAEHVQGQAKESAQTVRQSSSSK